MRNPGLHSPAQLAATLGMSESDIEPRGHFKAKVALGALERPRKGKGRLVLVSAITPTPAGEGKTTTSVALALGLCRLGRRAAVALREPSLGPVFGVKGGGTGGGRAQIVPADDINLHFTGDIHAVSSAHNLLAAMVDNDLHFGSSSGLDARRTTWPRVLDMNDRSLREVIVGLGGTNGGVPRETRFDITAASEVMAVLCLASSLEDLRHRLSRIVVGRRKDGSFVDASALRAAESMTALLLDAARPNLVQTSEGGPAFVHGGPFANIAHGCSSVLATRTALHYADDVVTEAGFGFDLGGEKFLHLKCRQSGLWPRCVVLVATIRALMSHGRGIDRAALERGLLHLDRQVASVRAFGLEAVVAINVFGTDTDEHLKLVESHCKKLGVASAPCRGFSEGGEGSTDLARVVGEILDRSDASPSKPKFLYDLEAPYHEKVRAVARTIYGASDVHLSPSARSDLKAIEEKGYRGLPVCIAKTHLSLSDDPAGGGLPTNFDVTVRSVRLSAGAGFVVALMGDIMTMPGLSKEPAATRVRIADGRIWGLMQGE